ncbi:uncharacterized protein LOC128664565 [Bombina bombina]|uniref:uncharacterized protein LOC128664565 n=1 Tax=Bombina bombina TaxID=8345 RepID=UPI00235A93B3|nr:uncharacterized protein LOC128664565 [Bombina bombina]
MEALINWETAMTHLLNEHFTSLTATLRECCKTTAVRDDMLPQKTDWCTTIAIENVDALTDRDKCVEPSNSWDLCCRVVSPQRADASICLDRDMMSHTLLDRIEEKHPHATPTPQAQPGRSTNEAPTCSRSSSAVSRPSTCGAHGQFIRSTSTVTHSSSSADTLLDVRTSTPETGVGRATADLGRLFQSLTGYSSPLFDEEENSSREITINLMPIRAENPISDENTGGHDGSETPDILDEFGDAKPIEIHTP